MKRILIFSGTTEGRQLADILDASGICADVCVATGYGHEVMTEGQYRNIYTGRLTEEEMKEFMQKGDYAAIVDATHPYAVVVSSNIRQASAQAGLPYYRLRRTLQSAGDDSDVIYVKSQQECVRALEQTSGNILLTTGSKELHCYCENETLRERLFVRVLPGTESIEICHKNGILGRQIIAMQGPFSEEMNLALLHQYQIRYMVTKESGASGGFSEKINAAKKAGGSVFVKTDAGVSCRDRHGKYKTDHRGSGGAYKRRRSVIRGKKTAGCGAGAMECSCGTTAVLSGKRHSSMP